MRAFLPHSPFVDRLGITLSEIGDDHAVLRMPYSPEHTTVGTMVHGGALAACIDIGIMTAAWAGPRVPATLRGVTVSLSVEFLDPAFEEDVVVRAQRVRQGRRLSVCSVDLEGATSGKLLAKALGTYQVG
ncbi:PaaI family thioesterase [Rhodococcus sp. HNM0569]|nr:PaaI family thioesterase [Rhodococcus sp. HNM0569]NLU82384.1 PaaI family thioesterase [Rhodococcus sp. HNM0569]